VKGKGIAALLNSKKMNEDLKKPALIVQKYRKKESSNFNTLSESLY